MGKLTLPDVVPAVKAYVQKPGNSVGGSLHIVLDDGNITDADIDFCIEYAEKTNDQDGVDLAIMLKKLSKTQRKKLSRMFYALQTF